MHVAPVRPITYLNCDQTRKLNALQNNYVYDGIEHRKVSRWSNTQSDIRKTLESAPHTEKSRNKADCNQDIDILSMKVYYVAQNQYRAYSHED